jgi:hypothetical protein
MTLSLGGLCASSRTRSRAASGVACSHHTWRREESVAARHLREGEEEELVVREVEPGQVALAPA